MVRPLRRIAPLSGGNKLDTRLNNVVFPAPFGPISAWISPARSSRLAFDTARDYISEHARARPLATTAIAAGIGMLIGMIFMRR